MTISRPKYDCLKIKTGRVPILCCCWKGACRRSNMACVGERSWWPKYIHVGVSCPCRRWFVNIAWRGRNMHFLRLATHSTWIGVRSAEYMLGKFDCPCTKTKVENTIFFANFQVGEVPVSIGSNHILQFPQKTFENWRARCFLSFYILRWSRGRSRSQHSTWDLTTTK